MTPLEFRKDISKLDWSNGSPVTNGTIGCGTIGSCQSAATFEIVKRCWSRVRVYTKTAHRQNGPDQNGPKNFNF